MGYKNAKEGKKRAKDELNRSEEERQLAYNLIR